MKKWTRKIAVTALVMCCVWTVPATVIPAQAYTEEEKQMAKNWLSANGYSPTVGGAYQAYQDYLDGKIDPFGTGNGQTQEETGTFQETESEPRTDEPVTTEREEEVYRNETESELELEMKETQETEKAAETQTESETETETESGTETETESESENASETETETESETAVQDETGSPGIIVVMAAGVILMGCILGWFGHRRRRG